MIALAPMRILPPRLSTRVRGWAVAALVFALFLNTVPSVVRHDQSASAPQTAPAPIAPPSPQLPPGLGPVLNATLAANSAEDYAVTPLVAPADGLGADNPAQRFATTFGTQGVRVAPVTGPGFALRATAINTARGAIVLAATPPISDGPRVEYRQDGMTQWYVNGPRGLEQGFTFAAPPAGAEQFTLMLPVAGAALVQDGDTVMIGGLRYGGLSVLDATGATLPAHLDVADGTIRIAVDATGAQWPVTVDPTITSATISADDHAAFDQFGESVAATTLNGTTYIVVGAPQKTVGGNAAQGEAFVFAGSAGTYNQRARLTATDGVANNDFGGSVAITPSADGTTV
ncbi:MAG: FG-GAP repeat protein, partial [Chloroflexota bacterium]|nr:FG-GAP repeat protein [Chloroflexota bacterium]